VFDEVTMPVGNGEQFPVTISAGAAGSDRFDSQDLVKEADRMMYENKEAYYKTHKRYR